jgi:hypothetical protein
MDSAVAPRETSLAEPTAGHIVARAHSLADADQSLSEPGAIEAQRRRILRRQRLQLDGLHDQYQSLEDQLRHVIARQGIALAADRHVAFQQRQQLRGQISSHLHEMHQMQQELLAAADARDAARRRAFAQHLVELMAQRRELGSATQLDLVGEPQLVDTMHQALALLPAAWCAQLLGIRLQLRRDSMAAVWFGQGRCVLSYDGSARQAAHLLAHLIEVACPQLRRRLRVREAERRSRHESEQLAAFCELLVGADTHLDEPSIISMVELWLSC